MNVATDSCPSSTWTTIWAVGDVRAADQMPVHETADVDGDVAFALIELGGDLLERHRPSLEVGEPEDAALELGQDAGGRGGRSDAVDEDRDSAFHAVQPFVLSV
jgi:hypothetical protein